MQTIIVLNYQLTDKEEMTKWKEFGEDLESELHFIFETRGDFPPASQEYIYNKFFENGEPDFSFEMTFFSSEKLKEKVMKYAQSRKIELIIADEIKNSIFQEFSFE